ALGDCCCRIIESFYLCPSAQYLKRVGYCPEEDPLILKLTGREMLNLIGRLRGISGNALNKEVQYVLHQVTAKEVVKNCFGKDGFESPAASAPEKVDSNETNGGASSSSTIPRESERDESQEALLEEDEQDQEALSGAWQSFTVTESLQMVSLWTTFSDSCIVVTEEVTVDSIVKEVLGESEDDDSEANAEDPCEVPSSREVLDAIDVHQCT
ncbi:hypothetical protein HPB47_016887, partial [Ixodes persulcatus]